QPQDSITHLLRNMILADKYLETEQKGKALATLDSLLKLHPNYWLARNNRGMLLLEQGDYMGAIEDFNNAIQNNKKEDADLHVAKARALQKSEQLVEAKKEYEKAIEIDTTKRKDVERPLQQTKKAIELNQTKLRQAPKETKAAPAKQELIEKIDANVKLGTVENKKEARRLVAKGIEQYPTEASFYVADILVLWQQNKKKEAWAKYNEALKKGVNREELNALLKAKNVKMERLKQVEK
ncbi:MAG: tetratricopeptide repeat protein, partial [Bacteroidota bacterium]